MGSTLEAESSFLIGVDGYPFVIVFGNDGNITAKIYDPSAYQDAMSDLRSLLPGPITTISFRLSDDRKGELEALVNAASSIPGSPRAIFMNGQVHFGRFRKVYLSEDESSILLWPGAVSHVQYDGHSPPLRPNLPSYRVFVEGCTC